MAKEVLVYRGRVNTTKSAWCSVTERLYSVTVPTDRYNAWRATNKCSTLPRIMPWLNEYERQFLTHNKTPAEAVPAEHIEPIRMRPTYARLSRRKSA